MEEIDLDFYSDAEREQLLDDDEISPEEAAFMMGYEDADGF